MRLTKACDLIWINFLSLKNGPESSKEVGVWSLVCMRSQKNNTFLAES